MTIRNARPRRLSRLRITTIALGWMMMVPLLGPPAAVSAGPPPFGIGDWVVAGAEILKDTTLLLDGNLTIQSGGSLTISNSSLTVHCRYSGEHGIRVMAGGTLIVMGGSMVNSIGEMNTFGFAIDAGAIADFDSSIFLGCGARHSGITSRSNAFTIKNCTFSGAFYALSSYASASAVSSRFIANQYAVYIEQSSMVFTDCIFQNNGWAVWPFRATAGFTGCDFTGNAIGISSEISVCRFRDCRFTKNYAMGIYVWDEPMNQGPSDISLERCTFEGNDWAIHNFEETVSNRLNISNCDILNSSDWGLQWTNADTAANYSILTASSSSRILNSTCLFNGQVMVGSGGNLSLKGSELRLDSASAGEITVDVRTGGRLSLEEGTVIRARDVALPYGLWCRPGSSFRMQGATIRDCGWNLSAPNSSGPLLETGDVSIISSTVDFNPAALVFNGSNGAVIERSNLRGMERGLDLNSSSVALRNSTLAAVGGNVSELSAGSILDCLNSVCDRKRLDFGDIASRANFSWLVDAKAVWADGRPVGGANLTIQNAMGTLVNDTVTGEDGYARGVVLMETSLKKSGALELTPHMFNCTRGSIWNRTGVTVNASREITLVLADGLRPTINITYPSDGISLGSGTVMVTGTAGDNMGLDRIELMQDGQFGQTVFASGGKEVAETEWNASLLLDEGYHFFEVTATDLSGNSASASVSVRVDTVSPRIRIASPQEDQLTNLSLLAVWGFMEPGARVLVCGTEAKTDRDRFSGSVTLMEGRNIITATAVDAAGNTNSSSVTVRLDSISPMLELRFPADGLRTRAPTVEVSGSMEQGSDVYVNGRQVAPGDQPGVFWTAIALTKEVTTVTVAAIDKAGNSNVTVRKVTLDTAAPFLKLSFPPEGLMTNRTTISIAGEAEAGCHLTVAGRGQQLQGEPPARAGFSEPVALHEGQNTILLWAMDMAGNVNSSTVHVTVDTVAPPLSVESPMNGSRTVNPTVLVEGLTEPGAQVSVNGQPVPVGYTGSFSADIRVYTGNNTIVVRVEDRAGNANSSTVSVQRVPASGGSLNVSGGGPDWPFWGFVCIAAAVAVCELSIFSRYIQGRRARVEGGG
jgi:hypothetical protein